ncbi:hypothetical protein KBK19_19875 [Microvirga sp. STR05]|uniref:DUF3108 domain-containing protein n=1 Tax=Hymenobacter duratus TaxID=2771356 RepID=A0ABR8JRZ6_9BACT|nr:DUF6134 family protein [Hymenobacter duratus]MBD2717309.1 hypothetical protein [Hymenobacter duratus]MBR7952229.1 hypothetical protein [Microvirga sp. STR05]
MHLTWLTTAALLGSSLLPLAVRAQHPAPAEVRRYVIEVAGLRVGTMTATRQPLSAAEVRYTLVSDVQVSFLVYHLKVYYKVINLVGSDQLLLSTVEAHTNQGNFASRTEWKGDHYDIVADQYKHHYRGTLRQPIRYTVTDMFFRAPTGQAQAYGEYFGDYFMLSPAPGSTYRARRDGREDEYRYADGQLTTIIKKNPLKNFVIRWQP